MPTGISVLDGATQQANIWIDEVDQAAHCSDRQRAYRLLRATLHTLRDWVNADQAADLGAQLPVLIRGVYYEGWDPSSTPVKFRKLSEFIDRMDDETPFSDANDATKSIAAAASVLRRHVTEGEIEDIRSSLPKDLQSVVGDAA